MPELLPPWLHGCKNQAGEKKTNMFIATITTRKKYYNVPHTVVTSGRRRDNELPSAM
jgi:hypothetical protein